MKNTELDPLAQNIKMLAHWDGEGLIRSISMGGMGDSYEMPIQLLIVESLRRAIDEGLPDLEALSEPALNEWAEYSIDISKLPIRQLTAEYKNAGPLGFSKLPIRQLTRPEVP